ncbi:MAG: arginine--tRNA ligase [Nitrospirae bacterium]|nr:arginine--tRNA ligase [Nitrospirota bacterium]MCL5421831.1 arginine--tRNA ligase [Nitrospirota bacterium]
MEKNLRKVLERAIKKLGVADAVIEIEIPREEKFGDFATPVAMGLSKVLRKPPRKIAEDIVNAIEEKDEFERIDIAGPGFINFTFSREFLGFQLKTLLKEKERFVRKDLGKGRRIQIEFVSANPTGPLHLGHGRGAAVGAALSNLLEAGGYAVEREYYVNDAGRQVKLLGLSVFAKYQQLLGLEYPFPEGGYRGDYIEGIARQIIDKCVSKYSEMSFREAEDFFTDFSYREMLREIENDLKDFGIVFDTWQSERELYAKNDVDKAIDDLRHRRHLYEKDGALWFKATAFGDDKDRVIVKSDGEFTYFASDIAYHRKKVEKGFSEIIDIWGADHHGYISRLKAVIQALGYPREHLKVLLVQMVTLLRGGKPVQMSKRAGEFVTLREVMEEVGSDTTKFIFLTRRPDSHLEFDLEVAKEQSAENPVFYVQYANARISSIFVHAREKGMDTTGFEGANLSLLSIPEELRIIKKLLTYPMTFEGAVLSREPHRITFYLQELAGLFHPYYNKYKVVTDDAELSKARLALCEAIRIVLKDGLHILGLSAPERM